MAEAARKPFDDAPATQFVVMDLLKNLLTFAESPGEMSSFLTRQIREFLGARIVILVQHQEPADTAGFKLLSIQPARFARWDKLEVFLELAAACREATVCQLCLATDTAHPAAPYLARMGIQTAIVAPLRVGSRTLGCLYAIDFLDLVAAQDILRTIEFMTPMVALVLRNCTFIESLESEVRQRTQESNRVANQFRYLAQVVPVGIFRLDEDGRQVFGNERWSKITGMDSALNTIAQFERHIHPEDYDRVTRAFGSMIRHDQPVDAEFRLVRPDASVVSVILSAVPEIDDSGRMLGVIGTLTDITEFKRTEQLQRKLKLELEQSLKLESLGRLAGGIAHDMNNVLGAIQAVTETLQLKDAGGPELSASLRVIEKASTRGRDLVKGLTNFARKDLREPAAIDLNELVLENLEILQRTTLQRVKLVVDLQEPLAPILGERGALGSTLMNLCINALDAMPEGGTLTLSTRSLAGAQVEITVADTGVGIPAAILERVMEPFFTTKPIGKGTGLGLSMAYATVKAHLGTFDIQSQEGLGTRVTLRLPAHALPNPAADPARAPQARPGGLRILLVDDDELIRASVPAMLEFAGHQVLTASGGAEAIALLAAPGAAVNLVILDLNMPGMNGAETLRGLRQGFPDLPVLLATGHLDHATAGLVQADRRCLSLSKPFSMAELEEKVKLLMAGDPA
jgi:PAS domain S-box-containing protein